jgi:N4-gp56 family major capsid protein
MVQKYYDKLFLKIAESKLVHKQLGQHSTSIGQGEGGYGSGLIAWMKWTSLDLVTAGQGEGVPTTAVSMTATQVTATPAQYDNAVSISDILAYTSFGDVMKAAISRLAYNAGLSIDTVVRGVIAAAGQQVNGSSVAYWSAVPALAYLNISDIRRGLRKLDAADAFRQDDGNYVAVIHPFAAYDLMGDTTTGGWIDSNKYTEANAGKLMSGEIGKLLGCRFLSSTNAYTRGSSYDAGSAVVASATLFVTSIFGKDAFGVTDIQNLRTYVKGFGSAGTADPTDKVSTAGWKASFAAALLNTSFYASITNTISSSA